LKSINSFHTITRNLSKGASVERNLPGRRQRMKLITLLGILLTAIGVISLIYQGVPFTTREKVIDFGPVQAYKEKKKTIPLPPIIGVLAIGVGSC
jgi:hypothetical protein